MKILPIMLLLPDERDLFGEDIVNLGILKRNSLPVVDGVVVTPPQALFDVASRFRSQFGDQVNDPAMVYIKGELKNLPQPNELAEALLRYKKVLVNGELVEKNKVWSTLINLWVAELKLFLEKGSYSTQILTPITIHFIDKPLEVVQAYFEPEIGGVLIQTERKDEKLNKTVAIQIDNLVLQANKRLILPKVYKILLDTQPKILSLKPFTQTSVLDITPERLKSSKAVKRSKSAVKVLYSGVSGYDLLSHLDGAIIEADKFSDGEELLKRLIEAAENFDGKSVILKLTERGIDLCAQYVLFLRNKKNLQNIEVAIPAVASVDDFLSLKRELAAREVVRKGSLKLWFEASLPANIIDYEEYLEAGVDGFIINIDKLFSSLLGVTQLSDIPHLDYKKNLKTLLRFLQDFMIAAKQRQLPVILTGLLSTDDQVVRCLYQCGIWGVSLTAIHQAESFPEYLNWMEKRMLSV